MIDNVIGAQLARPGQLGLAAGCGDDAALEQLGDLDGRGTDAAGGGQHEYVLTWLKFGAGHQHVPGGEEDQRYGGGFFEAEDRRESRITLYSGAASSSVLPPSTP